MPSNDLLVKTLKQAGYSVTQTRKTVFAALENQEPLTMQQLTHKLPDVDRASAYRTVALFERLGILRRLQVGWKYKLELSELFSYHHHHMSCVKCGIIVPVREDKTIETALHTLAHEYGFTLSDHQVEMQGVCTKCRLQESTP